MNKKQQKNNKNEKNAFVWVSLGSSFQQWHARTDSNQSISVVVVAVVFGTRIHLLADDEHLIYLELPSEYNFVDKTLVGTRSEASYKFVCALPKRATDETETRLRMMFVFMSMSVWRSSSRWVKVMSSIRCLKQFQHDSF